MSYDGVVGVDWSKRGEYMRHRHGVTAVHADEALADAGRVVLDPDPASESGRSVRTVGWSPSAGRLLTIITLDHEGTIYGVNGWESNPTDQRRYNDAQEGRS